VRIYGHYPVIQQDKTTYHRHLIRNFIFTERDGKEKWTTYRFTKNVYDKFMPMHMQRICSAVDELPPEADFEVSQQSGLQFPEDLGQDSQQSEVASISAFEEIDSQSGLIASRDITPNTSFTEPGFKKPRCDRKT
jgi:hypothetical protein